MQIATAEEKRRHPGFRDLIPGSEAMFRPWPRPGTHLDLIRGFAPAMRESDDEGFRRSTEFIDTSESRMKAADILQAVKGGVFDERKVAADLEHLCCGCRGAQEITLFKGVGIELEYLVAA